MEKSVAVRGDILHGNAKSVGGLSGGALHDIQNIAAVPQDIAFLDGLRHCKTVDIDDAVALCSVDGQNRFDFVVHFLPVHGGHVYGRAHERNRLVRLRRRMGTDLGADDYISLQRITPVLHFH